MANDFMYGVPPRHTHGENRVNRCKNFIFNVNFNIPSVPKLLKLFGAQDITKK